MADDTPDIRPLQRATTLPGRGVGEMTYLDFGDPSRPVDLVFLHANGFNAFTYRRILAPLARRFRILAIDQRGHGTTTLETDLVGRRDWLDLRDDLLAFLLVLNLRKVVLSGHSMGATASLLAAAAEPARCRRLTLFDPVILPQGMAGVSAESPMILGAQRRRAVFPNRAAAVTSYTGRGAFKTWPAAILADYVETGFRDTADGEVTLACAPSWEASGFAAHGHDPWDALRQSQCPIDILRAEMGSTFHVNGAEGVDPDRIRVSTAPGSTHFIPMEFPDLIRARLTSAIEA
jgi:pimeloyl-ACP methyl ester carboxylesterase